MTAAHAWNWNIKPKKNIGCEYSSKVERNLSNYAAQILLQILFLFTVEKQECFRITHNITAQHQG